MIRRIERIAIANRLQCCLILIGCILFFLYYFTLPPKLPKAEKVMVPFPQGGQVEKYSNVIPGTFRHEKTLDELLEMAEKEPEKLLVVYKNLNFCSNPEIVDYWFPGPGVRTYHARYEIPNPSSWGWRFRIGRIEYYSGGIFAHPDNSERQMATTLITLFSGIILVLIGVISWWSRPSSKD